MISANFCHSVLLRGFDLFILSFVGFVVERTLASWFCDETWRCATTFAIKVVVHRFRNVLSTIVAENRITASTDDLVAAIFLQYADFAFAASPDQSLCTCLFNHTPLGDAVLFLVLCAGEGYVRFQFTKST